MRLLFDHGTLVLAEAPDASLEFVPGLRWDPRVALHRAPAYRYAEVLAALAARQLPCRDEVAEPAGAVAPAKFAEISLRPYQQAALVSWELCDHRGLVVMPTGSGKTRVALAAMASGGRTLCLVPTRALLQQWLTELGRVYGGAIGCLGDGQRVVEAITVATFESAYRLMPSLGDRFDCLIVDEAHHFGSGMRDEALEMCTATRRLGLTATPPDERSLARLEQLLGPIAYQIEVAELTGSYLADYDLVLIPLGLNSAERAQYDADQRAFSELSRDFRRLDPHGDWRQLSAFAAQSAEGRAALQAFRRARQLVGFTSAKARAVGKLLARHHGSRSLVFTADNAAAYAIARQQLIMPITCDISRGERETALEAFRRGELSALVSARVLNEGIDVPDADVAIIVGSALGEREHVQRVGRLLRPLPGKRAIIYDLVTVATSDVRRAAARRRALHGDKRLSA